MKATKKVVKVSATNKVVKAKTENKSVKFYTAEKKGSRYPVFSYLLKTKQIPMNKEVKLPDLSEKVFTFKSEDLNIKDKLNRILSSKILIGRDTRKALEVHDKVKTEIVKSYDLNPKLAEVVIFKKI